MTKPLKGLDSWNSWRIAVTCGFVHLFGSWSIAAMGVIFSGLLKDFVSERALASWPVVAITGSMQLVSPLFSLLIRVRVPHLWIFRICSFTVALTLCLCYFANSILSLTVLMGLHGTSMAGIFVSGNVIMTSHFSKERSAASATQEMIAGTSIFFMPIFVRYLIETFQTTGGLSALGFASFLCFLLALTVTPLEGDSTEKETDKESTKEESVEFGPTSRVEPQEKPFWKVLMSPIFLLNVLSFWVIFEGYASFLQFNGDYAKDLNVVDAGIWLVPLFGVGDMIFKIIAGFLSDAKLISPTMLVLFGSVIQGVGFLALSYAHDFKTLAFSSFLLGASNGCRIFLFIIVLINDFGLDRLAHTFSHANLFMGVITLLKPFLVGLIRDQYNQYIGLFVLLAGLNALVAIYWAIRATKNRRQSLSAS